MSLDAYYNQGQDMLNMFGDLETERLTEENAPTSTKPEVSLHDMIRARGPEKAEKVFEWVWDTMIDRLHNSGEIPPEEHDTSQKWEAIGWWEKEMKKEFNSVIDHAIYDAYDGQVPE